MNKNQFKEKLKKAKKPRTFPKPTKAHKDKEEPKWGWEEQYAYHQHKEERRGEG